MLHKDRELFEQIVLMTAEAKGIDAPIVEKDYYVTIFLKEIVNIVPRIIFKGGTSLSKCYHLIERFSEDIDLNIDTVSRATEGERRSLNHKIVSIVEAHGFGLSNPDGVRSKRFYNKYIVDYPSMFETSYLKENLVIETSMYIRAYPTIRMPASSLLYEYLKENRFDDIIQKYKLEPFEVNVQTAERTLVDKVFALGDYYLSDNITEHSRHIYDIYKLLGVVSLDENFQNLVKEVLKDRRENPMCLSAQEGIQIHTLLQEIVEKKIYKEDYEKITSALLFEEVPYGEAIGGVRSLLDKGVLIHE